MNTSLIVIIFLLALLLVFVCWVGYIGFCLLVGERRRTRRELWEEDAMRVILNHRHKEKEKKNDIHINASLRMPPNLNMSNTNGSGLVQSDGDLIPYNLSKKDADILKQFYKG